jgi:NifU-like protein involved in Fe-S cluster formation
MTKTDKIAALIGFIILALAIMQTRHDSAKACGDNMTCRIALEAGGPVAISGESGE